MMDINANGVCLFNIVSATWSDINVYRIANTLLAENLECAAYIPHIELLYFRGYSPLDNAHIRKLIIYSCFRLS